MVLLALFGATAGQGVVWYTGQFYALTFIQKTCGIELSQSYFIIGAALVLATPFFIVFGSWSDRVGRKYIMMAGMLLAILTYRPIYQKMYSLADLNTKTEQQSSTVSETASLITEKTFTDGTKVKLVEKDGVTNKEVTLSSEGFWWMVGLVFVQVFYVTMVYGPIAAFLVELFPTRIRYTSMSLPYHIGNGVFGGLTPFIATSLYEASKTSGNSSGDPFAGLWYPIGVAAVSLVIGMLFLSNRKPAEVD